MALSCFRGDLLNHYQSSLDFTNNLKDGIIDPLRTFLETQVTNSRRYNIEIKELETEYRSVYDRLEKSKIRFHSYAKIAEDAKLQSEISKNNANLSNDQKSKFINKAHTCIKEAKEAEKIYIDTLNFANSFRERYLEGTKKVLDEFQAMEEKLIEFTKECLKKYFEYQFIWIKVINTEYEKKIKSVESVNTSFDIKDFIEKNSTNIFPPYKFEFVPYTSDCQTKHYDQANYPIGNFKIIN
jgi:hypothetical protein